MQSSAIEEALQQLLGAAVGPSGLVITVRRHEEYEKLLGIIDERNARIDSLKLELGRMTTYAHMFHLALDDLRTCERLLTAQGIDTSFIRSLRRGR